MSELNSNCTSPALMTLVRAASYAPSGDNTQPWHFTVNSREQAVSISVAPERDPSPMNAGQRMARMACGAALENMLRTLVHNQWSFSFEQPAAEILAKITLTDAVQDAGKIEDILLERTTNRKAYDAQPISDTCQQALRKCAPQLNGVQAHWLWEKEEIDLLTDLVSRADAVMLGARPVRTAFLDKVRLDAPTFERVDEGLCVGSLELPRLQQISLPAMRLPDWVLRLGGLRSQLAAATRRLLGSASGACLITAPGLSSSSEIDVGRVWQQAWLALTQQGLATQPMMSLPVLQTICDHASPEIRQRVGESAMQSLLKEFELFTRNFTDGAPAALMRIGHAPPPSARTGRLNTEQMTTLHAEA